MRMEIVTDARGNVRRLHPPLSLESRPATDEYIPATGFRAPRLYVALGLGVHLRR